MAYGVVHFFPGGTQSQYEASIAAVHPADGLPAGQTFHAAGPSEGGWTIMAVHESQASWEQFRDDVLIPRLQAGIPGGFEAPPEETAIDLVTVLP
jgi:predicted dienelactone hydrolase